MSNAHEAPQAPIEDGKEESPKLNEKIDESSKALQAAVDGLMDKAKVEWELADPSRSDLDWERNTQVKAGEYDITIEEKMTRTGGDEMVALGFQNLEIRKEGSHDVLRITIIYGLAAQGGYHASMSLNGELIAQSYQPEDTLKESTQARSDEALKELQKKLEQFAQILREKTEHAE